MKTFARRREANDAGNCLCLQALSPVSVRSVFEIKLVMEITCGSGLEPSMRVDEIDPLGVCCCPLKDEQR